jgi:hypothetical protein
MKLSDLKLDTVYADHEGTATVLVSLDKMVSKRQRYAGTLIRPATADDRGFGVLCVQTTYRRRGGEGELETLLATARELRSQPLPSKEMHAGSVEVGVIALRLLEREWDDHLIAKHMQAVRRAAAAEAAARARAERQGKIDRIRALLPDGVGITAYADRDHAQITLDDLLAVLAPSK